MELNRKEVTGRLKGILNPNCGVDKVDRLVKMIDFIVKRCDAEEMRDYSAQAALESLNMGLVKSWHVQNLRSEILIMCFTLGKV